MANLNSKIRRLLKENSLKFLILHFLVYIEKFFLLCCTPSGVHILKLERYRED